MAQQPSLFEFPSPSGDEGQRNALDHIFLALVPHSEAVEDALAIRESLDASRQPSARLRPGRVLHVTLRSMRDYRQSVDKEVYVQAVLAAVSTLRYPQTQVVFDRAEHFGGGAYVLTGNNPEVTELTKTLGVLLHRAGIASQAHTPHMTLLYVDGKPAPCSTRPLVWTAREVVLIRSYPGDTRHEHLGSVPLMS